MTDAQQLIDFARNQFNEIAADVERHFDQVAGNLRDRFARTLPTSKPVQRLPPPTSFQIIQRWISKHRALTAAVVAFLVTGSVGTYVYVKVNDSKRKRRAKKSSSGARTDVVVVAGAAANPLTSALYLELERRGFVVYVVSSTSEDEHYIRSQMRADLFPLSLDLIDPFTAQEQISRFSSLLSRDHFAFEGAEPHKLNLASLILVPDTHSAPVRVEDISSEEWSDALNAKILNTIATTQLLLPTVVEHKANVLLLTPSVTPSLKPPMHAIESTVYGALHGFFSSLAAELKQDAVSLSHLKIGSIDIPSVTTKQRRDGIPAPRLRPTSIRAIHDAVFDTIVSKRPRRTLYVGRGSLTYDVIGSMVPPALIGWMMGLGQRPVKMEESKVEDLQGSSGSLTWEKVEQEA